MLVIDTVRCSLKKSWAAYVRGVVILRYLTYYYALSINCENHGSPCELWKTNSLVLF